MRYITVLLLSFFSLGALAIVPPTMGWSSWNTYRVHISDSLIVRQAEALASSQLYSSGYRYINIDDGYFGGRDEHGNLLVHPRRFPGGLKPVVERIHALGLKAGIYSDAGRSTCGSFWDADSLGIGVGLYEHDEQDARFFFDSLRFDFIKIDFCGGDAKQNFEGLQLSEYERYKQIHAAIERVRPHAVRVNVCRWAFPGVWASDCASSWRISTDINPSWQAVKRIIAENRYLSAYAINGAYNDMDMLELGRGLSAAEERTHFALWCIQSSPLLIGCDLTDIPPSSFSLLTNAELIAVNQDPLGQQAAVVRADSGVYLYAKDLRRRFGTIRAVAVYNSTDEERVFKFSAREVLLAGKIRVYDLLSSAKYMYDAGDSIEVVLPPHDTRIFRVEASKRLMQTVYEAETAWLNRYQELGMNAALGYALYADDASCSAGGKTTFVGNHPDNWLEWRGIFVPRSGVYELCFMAAPSEGRELYCRVDGGESRLLRFANGAARSAFRVRLEKGVHTVRISNSGDWVPDLDKMEVRLVD